MRSRAFRRHQKERIYNRWLRIAKQWNIGWEGWRFDPYRINLERRHLWVKRSMENMPICSNPGCCGNRRRYGEVTFQERRAALNEKEQHAEFCT